jgi:hypothetical protein
MARYLRDSGYIHMKSIAIAGIPAEGKELSDFVYATDLSRTRSCDRHLLVSPGEPGLPRHQRSRRRHWLVSFLDCDLGFIDLEQRTLQPLDNPFGARLSPSLRYNLLPMSPGRTKETWGGRGDSNPRPKP